MKRRIIFLSVLMTGILTLIIIGLDIWLMIFLVTKPDFNEANRIDAITDSYITKDSYPGITLYYSVVVSEGDSILAVSCDGTITLHGKIIAKDAELGKLCTNH